MTNELTEDDKEFIKDYYRQVEEGIIDKNKVRYECDLCERIIEAYLFPTNKFYCKRCQEMFEELSVDRFY